MNFSDYLISSRTRIEKVLERALPPIDHSPEHLHQAMRYAVLNGGKRLRPTLVYASGAALGVRPEACDSAACAIELVHTYSLIHDDLPAMDDDDLRRGQPTCHKAFDEATAILAGDALQALAFELLTQNLHLTAEQCLAMLHELAHAGGSYGMAGGQSLDLAATGKTISVSELNTIHQLKTGRLIRACIRMAAIAANLEDTSQRAALDNYADYIGLAFQVQDDILDIEASTAVLGKTQGADQALGKATYPALLGLAAAKAKMHELYQLAADELKHINLQTNYLSELIDYLLQRQY